VDRALRNFYTRRHVNRKVFIVEHIYRINKEDRLHNKCFINGRLRKGKVHCSCPMCSRKAKTNGYKHSDKVRMEKGVEK
jgi:hypothetical protein